MTITTLKWTIADYHRLIEAGILDDHQVELLNGDLVEMSPEGVPHASSINEAADYLRDLLGTRARIREQNPVTLLHNSEPEPDIAVVTRDATIYRDHHPYPENIYWLIEYADSSIAKDLEIKRTLYALADVQEYWVINLKTMELIVHRTPINGNYQSVLTLTQGDITPLAFLDISVSVQQILRR